MARIAPFKATLPDLSGITSNDSFFSVVKHEFSSFVEEGLYYENAVPAVYIYRIATLKRSYTGLLVVTHVEDYISGVIKRHENTLAEKEATMLSRFHSHKALIKPLLFTYPNVLDIDALINRLTISSPPSQTFSYQHERHTLWQIDEPVHIEMLQGLFAQKVPYAYIADGHHRAKTAEVLYLENKANNPNHTGDEPYNYVLSAYFPASEIEIHNFNRTLSSLKGLSIDEFLEKINHYYQIIPSSVAVTPITKYQVGMYLDSNWYELQLRPEFQGKSDEVSTRERLDVDIFNKRVLQEILNIQDVRTEPEVRYIEGPKGTTALEKKVNKRKALVGFNLYPAALEDLIKISHEGDTMPPKSTWIEPRMRSGLIVHTYD